MSGENPRTDSAVLPRAAGEGRADLAAAPGGSLSRIPLAGAAAVAGTLVFVVLASRHITLPGTYPDELFQIVPALNFVDGPLATDAVPATGPTLTIGDHSLAAMTSSYSGQVKTLAYLPLAALFDITAESVRYFAIAVAGLALLATYAFARRMFRSEAIALVAMLLLALEPSFIFYSRTDYGQTLFMLLARGVAIWQLLRWWDTRSTASLVLGALALGIGLYDKFIFVWVIWGLAAAVAIVAGREVWRRLDRRTIAIFAAAFLAGCLPLVVYELRSDLGTLNRYDEISESSAGSDAFPYDEPVVPTGGFVSNLGDRLGVLGDLLDGSTVARLIDSPFPHHFTILPLLFALAALAIGIQLVVRRPPSRELRAGAFALVVILVVLVCTALTRPGFHGHHLLLTYPFPHVVLALVLVQAARRIAQAVPPPRRRAALAAAVTGLAAIPLTLNAVTTGGMIDSIPEASGRGGWSEEIYDLEPYLTRAHEGKPVVTADWGIAYQLLSYSQGELEVKDVALRLEDPETPAQPAALLSGPFRDRRTWFVLRSPFTTVNPDARRRFFSTATRLGYRPTLVRRLDDSRGRPQFEVYSVERSRPA